MNKQGKTGAVCEETRNTIQILTRGVGTPWLHVCTGAVVLHCTALNRYDTYIHQSRLITFTFDFFLTGAASGSTFSVSVVSDLFLMTGLEPGGFSNRRFDRAFLVTRSVVTAVGRYREHLLPGALLSVIVSGRALTAGAGAGTGVGSGVGSS
jgi:hypothetical protein